MNKSELFKEDFITIIIVLSLVFYDYVLREAKSFEFRGILRKDK